MAITIPQIDYTSKDFESLINDLLRLVPKFTEEWTDLNATDPGVVLAELWAYVGGGLHFQIDRQANESFLPTAIKRESVVKHLRNIDFNIPGASPGTTTLTFSIADALPDDFTIPATTEVQTVGDTDPVFFETDVDAIILQGALAITVAATEGQSSGETVTVSDGTAFQKRTLVATPIIDDTSRIFIDEGSGEEEWLEVESFVESLPADKSYKVERNADDTITIIFGDDANGKIPLVSSTIRAEYRTGGGTRGNVGANTITKINDTLLFGGQIQTVAVTNAAAVTNGAERQGIEEAKIIGPRTLRALFRAVTLQDYKTLTENFLGVAKAIAVEQGFGQLDVHIAPDGGGIPSTSLKDAVKAFLDDRKCAGTILTIQDPTYINIDIAGTVFVKPNFVNATVKADVEAQLAAELSFANVNRGFGDDVFFSDMLCVIDNAEGVDHVDLTRLDFTPNDTIVIGTFSGNATIGDITTSATTLTETWTLAFTSATTFTLTGSVSGLQVNVGSLDTIYTSDNNEISLLFTTGTNPMAVSDSLTFRTTLLLGNVIIDSTQIAQQGLFTLNFTGGAT